LHLHAAFSVQLGLLDSGAAASFEHLVWGVVQQALFGSGVAAPQYPEERNIMIIKLIWISLKIWMHLMWLSAINVLKHSRGFLI
jgi:hypothetical protein